MKNTSIINALALLLAIFALSCNNTGRQQPDNVRNEETAAARADEPGSEEVLRSGEELFQYFVCMSCHSFDGRQMYGPGLDSIFMKELTVKRQGEYIQVIADREYLERSILDPDRERLKGYESRKMPVPDMSPEEAEVLVDYIISFSHEEKSE